ncbi:MAG: hypothetical protein QOG62_1555 [Thermoleophilaceae bacterium]|jgi:hypothetical protein|nr:hypothetical protein [Thermoleophilaceae bacterium]
MALLLSACLVLHQGPPAEANGSPPSDFLLEDPVYLPIEAPTSPREEAALRQSVGALRTAGVPLYVAVILTTADLGIYPEFLDKPPQAFADLLLDELALGHQTGQVLVVATPRGLAVAAKRADLPRILAHVDLNRVRRMLAKISVPAHAGPDELAAAADGAVRRLGPALGVDVGTPADTGPPPQADPTGQRHPAAPAVLIAVLGLGLLLALGLAVAARRRRVETSVGDE